ncbi:hypothetical protein L2E82_20481 [Cichorium intybus]|uniref:Uncharacterized protein n=1 Tax=Cichorium intybus TaxID=13427 RepID=A0ACB9DT53_CICIN|nr:hypothetical protein L2E82_20481 [Cichorium intybus]
MDDDDSSINKILADMLGGIESMANILEGVSTRVQYMETELQMLRKNQNEDDERFACSQHHRRPPPHHHRPPQLDQLNEGGNSSSDEECRGNCCRRKNRQWEKMKNLLRLQFLSPDCFVTNSSHADSY